MGFFWQALYGVITLLVLQDAGVMSRGASSTIETDDLHLSATKEIISGSNNGDINSIQIEPSQLIFKNSPTCIPSISMIDILNIHETEELQILSIKSDNSQFHPAIFKPQVLLPEGRASIQIIYLPRNIGSNIECKLTIMTSFGELIYLIQASAINNLYHLHPFIGTKIPSGVIYSRPIIMYNPTDKPLHVREVFTTESFLTLNLPEDLINSNNHGVSDDIHNENNINVEEEHDDDTLDEYFNALDSNSKSDSAILSSPTSSQGLWIIPPKSEKEIIHLIFHATTPGPFNGYVHVKSDLENMVIPVELHVLKGGLHPTPKNFDFGILTSPDEKRLVSISLLNSGNLPIELLDAIPSLHDPSLEITFMKGLVILPGIVADSVVHLQYSGSNPGPTQGKVIMTTNHSNSGLASVEVFYSADVLHGGVGYERSHVSFVVPIIDDLKSLNFNNNFKQSNSLNNETSNNNMDHSLALKTLILSNSMDGKNDDKGKVDIMQKDENVITRLVPFTNYFPIPLLLKSVSMESCGDVLSVGNLTNSAKNSQNQNDLIALTQKSWPNLKLKFDIKKAIELYGGLNDKLPHTCSILLTTNVSLHHIPVHIYDGRLKVNLHSVSQNISCISSSSSSSSNNNLIPNVRANWMDDVGNCYSNSIADQVLVELKKQQYEEDQNKEISSSISSSKTSKKTTESSSSSSSLKSGGVHRGSVKIEFGKIGYQQSRSRFMNITNLNPVPVNVSSFMTDLFRTSTSSSTSTSPSSEFYYHGQSLSSYASKELVEVYEDMLNQGAVLPTPNRNVRKQVNYGKFSIFPGHSALFEIEINTGNQSLNSTSSSLKNKSKKQKKMDMKLHTKNIGGFIIIMETPVEVIRYYMSLEIIPGHLSSSIKHMNLTSYDDKMIYNGGVKKKVMANNDNDDDNVIKLVSHFYEDILVCDLISSQSDWVSLSLIQNDDRNNVTISNNINLIQRSEECSENSIHSSSVILPGILNKKVLNNKHDNRNIDVGKASTLSLNPMKCIDIWFCIGKWAHELAYPYLNDTSSNYDLYRDLHKKNIDNDMKNDKDYDKDNDYAYLEAEENQILYENNAIHSKFMNSFDHIQEKDIQQLRLISKNLASLILKSQPSSLSKNPMSDISNKHNENDLYEDDEDFEDEDDDHMKSSSSSTLNKMMTMEEHEDLIKLNSQWETFKSFGLHEIKSKVSAVTSVGTMKDLLSITTELKAPKLHIERSGFGIANVGDISSEYFTIYNHGDKPISLQLTALINDPTVAFASDEIINNDDVKLSHSSDRRKRKLSSNSRSIKLNENGVDSEWWNMKLKTVNNGVGRNMKSSSSSSSSSNWRNDKNGHFIGKSHVMNLKSTLTGEVGSTCPIIDGACYLKSLNNNTQLINQYNMNNPFEKTLRNDNPGKQHQHQNQNQNVPISKNGFQFPTWVIDQSTSKESLFNMARNAIKNDENNNHLEPFFIPRNASKQFIIQPGDKTFIGPIFFRPYKLGLFKSQIYIKNNYSRNEIIPLEGKAGSGLAVVRTKGGYLHHLNEIFTLKFILNTSYWQPYNESQTIYGEKMLKNNNKEKSSYGGWFSSLEKSNSNSNLNNDIKVNMEQQYYGESDHIQYILKGGSSEYYEPPIWPNPAVHIVRVENHGDLPIEINSIIVGSLMEEMKTPFNNHHLYKHTGNNKKYSNEFRNLNKACVGIQSGFVVQGCEELPIMLGSLQAWNVLVSYYADCSTINDVDTLQIQTSVGNFDIILQAISKKSDMAKCEAYKMSANSSSYSSMFVRLPIICFTFLCILFSFTYVKSMYYSMVAEEEENAIENDENVIMKETSTQQSSNMSKKDKQVKNDVNQVSSKQQILKTTDDEKLISVQNDKKMEKKNKKGNNTVTADDVGSGVSQVASSNILNNQKKNRNKNQVDEIVDKNSEVVVHEKKKGKGKAEKNVTKNNQTKNDVKGSSLPRSTSTSTTTSVISESTFEESTIEGLDSNNLEFLVQVEEEQEQDKSSRHITNKSISPLKVSSSLSMKPIVEVNDKTSKTKNAATVTGEYEMKDPIPQKSSQSSKKSNKSSPKLGPSSSSSQATTLVPSVSALLSSASLVLSKSQTSLNNTSSSSNQTLSDPNSSIHNSTKEMKEMARSRREKKKIEDKERKENEKLKKDEEFNKLKLSRRDSDKEKKEQVKSQKQIMLEEKQREVKQREVQQRKKDEEMKKKNQTKSKLSSNNVVNDHHHANHQVKSSTGLHEDGVDGIGIAGGWVQPAMAAAISALPPQPSYKGNHGNDQVNNNRLFEETSPILGPNSSLLQDINMSTISPLRSSSSSHMEQHNIPLLNLSPEPDLNVLNSRTSPSMMDSMMGHHEDTSIPSNNSLFNMTSSSGLGSLRHGLDHQLDHGGRGFDHLDHGLGLFSNETRGGVGVGRSSSQESDLNVDSFFADLSSSIAASLDLDISDPENASLHPNNLTSSSSLNLNHILNSTSKSTTRSRLSMVNTGDIDDEVLPFNSSNRTLDPQSKTRNVDDGHGDESLSPTMSRSRLSHYIKGDSLRNSNHDTENSSSMSSSNNTSINSTSGGGGIVLGSDELLDTSNILPDYHKDAVELDFFEQSQSFFASTNSALLDDDMVLEDEENYLQGGGDEDDWE